MAGVGVGAEVLSSVIRTAREGVGGRQRCHWISSPSLPLPSARRLFKQQASRFQLLRYPVVSLCAAGNPSPPPTSSATSSSPTRLYVSGLSFRTTEESLRNAFEMFGQLTEVNLVMDKIANRPRGFAFLRYATEEEARKAIDGMHGKVFQIKYETMLSGSKRVPITLLAVEVVLGNKGRLLEITVDFGEGKIKMIRIL